MKAQYGLGIRFFLIVMVLLITIMFGFKVIKTMNEKACVSQLVLLEKKLKSSLTSLYGRDGIKEEERFNVGCGIEKIYLVDTSLYVGPDELDNYPEIIGSVIGGAKNNLFLLKGERLKQAFYIGELNLLDPYYVCVKPRDGIFELYLKGLKTGVEIQPKPLYNCGPMVVETSPDVEDEIASEVGMSPNEFKEKINKVRGKLDVTRTVKENKVKINIKPKEAQRFENLEYIERIRKACINELTSVKSSPHYTELIKDPLIVWWFSDTEISEITYELSPDEIERLKECNQRGLIDGVVLADSVEEPSNEVKIKEALKQEIHLNVRAMRRLDQPIEDITSKVESDDTKKATIKVDEYLMVEFQGVLGEDNSIYVKLENCVNKVNVEIFTGYTKDSKVGENKVECDKSQEIELENDKATSRFILKFSQEVDVNYIYGKRD